MNCHVWSWNVWLTLIILKGAGYRPPVFFITWQGINLKGYFQWAGQGLHQGPSTGQIGWLWELFFVRSVFSEEIQFRKISSSKNLQLPFCWKCQWNSWSQVKGLSKRATDFNRWADLANWTSSWEIEILLLWSNKASKIILTVSQFARCLGLNATPN